MKPLVKWEWADLSGQSLMLMHGTTMPAYEKILEDGIVEGPVYLTDCFATANYYAKQKSRKQQGQPCVLFIEVSASLLAWDWDSFFEPIPINIKKHNLNSKDSLYRWWKNLDLLCEQGGVHFLKSLEMVNAVKSMISIDSNSIRWVTPIHNSQYH